MRTPAYERKIAAVHADFNNSISALAGEVRTNDREHNKKRIALAEVLEVRIAALEREARLQRIATVVSAGVVALVGLLRIIGWWLERAR